MSERNPSRARSWKNTHQDESNKFPSTVDVNALKSGLMENETSKKMDTTSSSSESDSTSNSSDSGSSTTSDREKRGKSLTKATKFSVTSSDKSGLKMKIAAIPRNIKSALKSTKKDKSLSQQKKATKKRKNVKITQGASKNIPSDASSTSSYCSACNESESESSSDENTNIEYKKTKKHRRNRKSKTNQSVSSSSEVRTDSSDSELCKAITNERNSEDLAGILPSECIKEFEGLTTSSKCHIIQVAQNMTNLDTSNSTIANTSSYVTTMKTNIPPPTEVSVDGGSSSDMELPAIVNAAIKLVENCSDSEAGGKPTIPLVQYNSPLLLDFMVKTQMLGKTSTSIAENLHSKAAITFTRTTESEINEDPHNRKLHIKNQTLTSSPLSCLTSPFVKNDEQESVQNKLAVVEKRKRGRPRKQIQKTSVGSSTIPKNNPTTTTSGSPDSGILSITQSPSHSPNTGRKHIVQIRNTCDSSSSKNLESTMKKTLSTGSLSTTINLASLEKSMYATERVLYPPRGRRRGPGRPSNKTKQTKTEETIDPAWTKIDINKKFRRPSVSGYKSDGGTVCSKVLASQCGYTSDYGAIRRNRLSGYRSDYSKKSGYRSDYSIKAKSCGYRSDCSIRHRKKVRRKRRMKANSTVKSAVTDQDILQLAGLSLGQSSEENSLDTQPVTLRNCENFFISSLSNNNLEMTKKLSINPLAIANVQEIHVRKLSKSNPMSRRTENLTSSFKDTSNQKSVENINTFDSNKTTTNFESKMKSMTSFASISSGKLRENLKNMEENSCSFDTLVVNCELKMSERTCLKSPSKAATIRSRRSSAVSRCSSRSTMSRHYLKRRRKKRLRSRNESIGSRLTDSKFLQELDRLIISFDDLCHISENGQKNVAKEQERESEASNLKNNSKRATKKRKVTDVAVSPSTSTSGKRRNKKAQTDQSPDDHKLPLKKRHYLLMPGEKSENRLLEDKFQFDEAEKNVSRAVTPKKRHLTQKQEHHIFLTRENITSPIKSSNSPITIETKPLGSCELNLSDVGSNLRSRRSETMARKKNRLEVLVSKMQSSPSNENQNERGTSCCSSLLDKTLSCPPPPGVFEPSIDLELQIPVSTIVIPSLIAKIETLDSPRISDSMVTIDSTKTITRKPENVVEVLLNKTTTQICKRKRKKTINRTGFPTVKKKKKIVRDTLSDLSLNEAVKESKVQPLTVENVRKISEYCQRVPADGEATDSFMERNNRPRLSVVSLERLQGKVSEETINSLAVNNVIHDRIVKRNEINGEILLQTKRELRTRNCENERNNKSRNRGNMQENDSINKKTKKFEEVEALKKRDQSSDNEPLINFIESNKKPKKTRKKGVSTLIDNLTPKEILPDSTKRTRLQSEIEKKNKLEAEMQPIVKLESMEGTSGIILPKRTNTRFQSTALISSSLTRPKSRMEVKISPLTISRDTSSEVVKEIAREIEKELYPQSQLKVQHKNLYKKLDDSKKMSNLISKTSSLEPSSRHIARKGTIQENLKSVTNAVCRSIAEVLPDQSSKQISKNSIKQIPREINKQSINTNAKNKVIAKDLDKGPKRKRANSIEILLNHDESIQSIAKRGLMQENQNENAIGNVSDNVLDKNKQTEKSSNPKIIVKDFIKTRTSIKKKSLGYNEMNLTKRLEIGGIVSETKERSSKKIENLGATELHSQELVLPEVSVRMNTAIIKSSMLNSRQSYQPEDMQIQEELEQEPLPDNEGPSCGLQIDESLHNDKDTFKEDENRKHCRFDDFTIKSLLPPPPYCERFFRRTERDFLLPYDLWWAHENDKLPCRNAVPSWNYKKIRTNVYIDVRANPCPEPSCSCKPNTQCAEDCLNRVVYTECNTETCPCGDKCQNTKIQKHEYAPGLEKFMTVNKGWGVRTKTSIKKSTFIIEYVGEVVTDREFKDRMATVYIRDTHHYCLHLDGGLVIDGHRMGSDGRFVNHSCAPNCEMQKWSVNGLPRMVLFAARDIKAGEELTYDYNFALFNPAEGQPCLCESSSCRGVIGGKSQRIKPMEPHKMLQSKSQDDTSSRGRSRKRTAKKNQFQNTGKDRSGTPLLHVPSNKEQIIIKESHCFLLRNLGKIRRLRDRLIQRSSITMPSPVHLFTRITEVRSPRNIRTRGLTVGDHDPEIDKMAKMAVIFKDLCSEICNFKETGCQSIINKLALPSKKKLPQYYEKVIKPIDMTQIEAKVERGEYKNPSAFDEDVQRLFNNVMLFYPSTSDEAKAAQSLMTLFANKKQLVYEQLVQLVDDRTTLKGFERSKVNELVLKAEPNEDVIHCICGLFKDEGLMIQCSDCQVWQHTECTKANTEIENYKCEKCEPRPIDLEIPLDEFTDEGYRYYISLLRGQLQVRQSDTVYVLRDIPVSPDPKNPNLPLQKHTYKTIGDIDFSEFDIFRVERLWKDNEGKRFVFGHQYLKPHETYHEPTRKFYPNEVVRVPLYEVVPIELIMGRCWVLDPTTYCKGRPVDCDEKHVYICELRVDKGARLFSKISKHAYPTCTKSYAFRKFDQKQKISRTYAPHEVKPMKSSYKPKKRKDDNCPIMSRKNSTSIIQLMPPPPKTLNEKRNRLEETLMNLMNRLKSVKPACLPPMDLSYLLTGRGARQRRANATSVPG